MHRLIALVLWWSLVWQAGTVMALDMEYYTYGGFAPIVQSFTKVALIFSDQGYQGLLLVVTLLGCVAAAVSWLARVATGARIVPLVWAVPVICGAVVYMALFMSTGSITVYDPTLNRFQKVGEVPDGIVFTAGFLNKIEKGMVDIIDTASAPDADYQATAGGLGFKALAAIRGSSPVDNYARTSMIRYVKDCVTFELIRPGTTLSLDDLRNTSVDFIEQLGEAVHPSIYTLYYDSTTPEGTTLSCTDAYSRLQVIYSNPNSYDEAVRKVCSKAHFDPDNTVEMNTCQNLIAKSLRFTTGIMETPARLIQQRQIAEILYFFYFQDDYETSMVMEADRKITSTGFGIGLTMNEWIPIIRAILTAVAIGTLPFLALFLPTPVLGRAASVMFGFFVFLTTWGVTDAVIHGAAMDYASYAFEDMRQSSLGVYGMAALPTLSMKMLAMFGVIRSAGIMLASIFSMMLLRFGGSALAHFATNLSGIARSAGAEAGRLMTPEGNAVAMSEQVRVAGLLEGMQEHRFSNMAAASAYRLHQSVGGYGAAMHARDALQESGQIPVGTTSAQMAQMSAASRISVGTGSGPVEVSTSPDGQGTRMKGETVNADGSTTIVTTGVGGAGVASDTLAEGKASYHVDSAGNRSLSFAAVNGLNPVSVGASAQHQKVVSASDSLGGGSNWNLLRQQIQKESLSSAAARSYASRLDNTERTNWSRMFKDSSSFVHTMQEATRTQFMSTVGAGFKGIRLGANGQILVVGNNNEEVDFNVSEDTAKAFARDQARVRSEAIQETFNNSIGLDYITNMAHQIGANEAYSFLNDAREIRGESASYGADLTTALVRNYAMDRYGTDSPEHIRSAIRDFNYFLTRQGAGGVHNMNQIIEGFVSGKGYGWGNTRKEVKSAIDATKDRIHDDILLKGGVGQAGGVASGRTVAINQNRFSEPGRRTDQHMEEPDPSIVVPDANKLRNINRDEENGSGRIQTTAPGMAVEGAEKVLFGAADGQGNRPTKEGYFDKPPVPASGFDLPEPGPIPDDAKSSLGMKR